MKNESVQRPFYHPLAAQELALGEMTSMGKMGNLLTKLNLPSPALEGRKGRSDNPVFDRKTERDCRSAIRNELLAKEISVKPDEAFRQQ